MAFAGFPPSEKLWLIRKLIEEPLEPLQERFVAAANRDGRLLLLLITALSVVGAVAIAACRTGYFPVGLK
jgi:hypothetical protein